MYRVGALLLGLQAANRRRATRHPILQARCRHHTQHDALHRGQLQALLVRGAGRGVEQGAAAGERGCAEQWGWC